MFRVTFTLSREFLVKGINDTFIVARPLLLIVNIAICDCVATYIGSTIESSRSVGTAAKHTIDDKRNIAKINIVITIFS